MRTASDLTLRGNTVCRASLPPLRNDNDPTPRNVPSQTDQVPYGVVLYLVPPLSRENIQCYGQPQRVIVRQEAPSPERVLYRPRRTPCFLAMQQ